MLLTPTLTLIPSFINQGTGVLEEILLDIDQIGCLNLSSKEFKNMPSVRLLTFRDLKGINFVYLPMGLDLLPKTGMFRME